jgi:ABC-type bacteriocin/lantibiotic exporter with double-glycine peptidase domain
VPTRLLNTPHRLQEEEAGCLAACAQMLLQHIGVEATQSGLNRLFGLTSIGIPYSNIRRLEQLGVHVEVAAGDDAALRSAIDRNQPVIVFVKTGDLSYWSDNTPHAVVVVGYDDEHVLLNDPIFAEAPKRSAWNEFMLAWSEQDYMLAIVEN